MAAFMAMVAAPPSNAFTHDIEDAAPAAPAAEAPPHQDTQHRLAEFIAKNWRVKADYALTVVKASFDAASRYQVDPIVILAIAAKESSFRHVGRNPNNTYGIMQVIGRLHKDKFEGGRVRATSVTENIHLGAQVMREALDRERGDIRRALMRYNGSPNKVNYSRAVLQLEALIKRALHPQ